MKAPHAASPLSPPESSSYEQLTFAIVQHTIAQYASFLSSESLVDQFKWKHLKSRENVDIYRARADTAETSLSGLRPPSTWQPQAKLLCVGTIRGTLDDAMYGAITPSVTAMATRSLYIRDEFVSHRVLQDIELPTAAEPFRYLGLKWVARSPSLAAIIRPRDMVYIEASGVSVMLTPDGHERVGYVVYDSVDLPDLDPTTEDRPVRARARSCYLFRQVAPNTVALYGTMLSNAGGSLPARLAALSGAAVMISVSKVADCAFKKKLAWMRRTRVVGLDQSEQVVKSRQRQCPVCSRGLSHLSSVVKCRICYIFACSRCITTRSLVVEKHDAKLAKVSMPMCKSCVASAVRSDSGAELATREYVRGQDSALHVRSPCSPWDSALRHGPSFSSSTMSNRATHTSFDGNTPPVPMSSAPPDVPVVRGQTTVDEFEEFDEGVVEEISTNANLSTKVDLWIQMNALRLQAEHTFHVVSQQTEAQFQSLRRSGEIASRE